MTDRRTPPRPLHNARALKERLKHDSGPVGTPPSREVPGPREDGEAGHPADARAGGPRRG